MKLVKLLYHIWYLSYIHVRYLYNITFVQFPMVLQWKLAPSYDITCVNTSQNITLKTYLPYNILVSIQQWTPNQWYLLSPWSFFLHLVLMPIKRLVNNILISILDCGERLGIGWDIKHHWYRVHFSMIRNKGLGTIETHMMVHVFNHKFRSCVLDNLLYCHTIHVHISVIGALQLPHL